MKHSRNNIHSSFLVETQHSASLPCTQTCIVPVCMMERNKFKEEEVVETETREIDGGKRGLKVTIGSY